MIKTRKIKVESIKNEEIIMTITMTKKKKNNNKNNHHNNHDRGHP